MLWLHEKNLSFYLFFLSQFLTQFFGCKWSTYTRVNTVNNIIFIPRVWDIVYQKTIPTRLTHRYTENVFIRGLSLVDAAFRIGT